MILRVTGIGLAIAAAMAVGRPSESDVCCPPEPGFRRSLTIEVVDRPPGMIAPQPGSVAGKVVFKKRRPKQPMVVYLVRKGGELALPDDLKPLRIGQKGARFQPDFAVVTRKQKVEFVNNESSEIDHNVYFLGDDKKDLGIFAKGVSRSHVFEKAGVVDIYCSIHSQMDGKIFIAPNPHFAVIGVGETTFSMSGVPAGDWELRTWQKARRFRDVKMPVTVSAGGQVDVSLEMSR